MQKRTASIILLIAHSSLMAQAPETASTTESGQNLFDLIQQGGWAMWPLGLCSLTMFFLFFYNWKETGAKKFIPAKLLAPLSHVLASRQMKEAEALLKSENTVLSRSLLAALPKVRPMKEDANRDKIEEFLIDALEAEENGIAQWINYLNVIATVSPMIGLLGTVSGMISAFQIIAEGGMGRPELLAGDIGEALITTATGLIIGIPAMIGYFVTKNRLSSQMIETTHKLSNLIDALAEHEDNDVNLTKQAATPSGT